MPQFDPSQPSYQALRGIVSERTRPLLAWVGAGLSAAAGLPTWDRLRQRLVESLEAKAATMDSRDGKKLKAAADLARYEQNLWRAFEVLQGNLGQTTFRDEIRESLKAAPTAPIPSAYSQLWQLRVRGVLSLNLDQLATRALL